MEKRKRGAQPGNQNAVGNRGGGAPCGNRNAQKHGLYARDGLLNHKAQEKLSAEIREFLFQRRLFQNLVEKVYNREITPEDLCRRYEVVGLFQLDEEHVLRILKEKKTVT